MLGLFVLALAWQLLRPVHRPVGRWVRPGWPALGDRVLARAMVERDPDEIAGRLLGAVPFAARVGVELLGPTGVALGWVLPAVAWAAWVGDRSRAHQRDAGRYLPGWLSLTAALLRAGVPIAPALEAAMGAAGHGMLRASLVRALAEIAHGRSLALALTDAAARSDLAELARLARVLERAESLGAVAAPVLEAAAERLRASRAVALERAAAEAGVRISLPLVVCFFPATALLLVAPLLLLGAGGR